MKKWLSVIFVLLSLQTFSQSSFKMQVDTSILIISYNAKMVSCVDGGIALALIEEPIPGSVLSNTFMYKCDANGNYEWTNYYNTDMEDFNPFWDGTLQLKATNDSGFYLLSHVRHDMFGWFDTPTLQKVKKDGIVTSAITANVPNTAGLQLFLNAVEKSNNNLHLNAISTSYDPYLDEICCYEHYGFKLDSSLDLQRRINFDYLFYDSLDVPFYARNKLDTLHHWHELELYDTSGYHFSTVHYEYDTNMFVWGNPLAYCQDNDYYYFLETVRINSQSRDCIHKVDKNFNTVFAIILDTSNILSLQYYDEVIMDKSAAGNLMISNIYGHPNQKYIPYMLEMDSSGTIIHAWKGDGADSSYLCSAIDTLSESILFASKVKLDYYFPFKIERQFLSSPSCGFIPITLNSFPITIVDSFFVTADTITEGIYPICNYITAPEVNKSSVPGYPLCGVLSGSHDPYPTESCKLSIFPNPANDKLNISFNCEVNQK
ncbi:MAG TPA: hypothetical protein PKD91_12550, partial [Bacteroidia bacterium]|nr:hypothetical protein [Bacteroidia bacterium]